AVGDVIGDMNSRHGKVLGTGQSAGSSIVTACVPLAQTLDYEPKLTAMTHGRGTFTLSYDHYDFCSPQTQEKVIRDSGVKPVAEGGLESGSLRRAEGAPRAPGSRGGAWNAPCQSPGARR